MPRTLWVIAYDITDDGLRTRVQHALEPVGERRQRSVFECRLSDEELRVLWQQLARLIDPATDSVLAWPLTAAGHGRSRALGCATVSPYELPAWQVAGPE
ncbi:MAG: CRISPR-associated endonuclease Cas2 [Fimbriimonadaceae bacterium]|nr:CRISPR-associated endonuclease Cas2 [Fimbriimonadaceae bacterium]